MNIRLGQKVLIKTNIKTSYRKFGVNKYKRKYENKVCIVQNIEKSRVKIFREVKIEGPSVNTFMKHRNIWSFHIDDIIPYIDTEKIKKNIDPVLFNPNNLFIKK